MNHLEIRQLTDWDSIPNRDALVELVQSVSNGHPYNYAPGEIAHASVWLPELHRKTRLFFAAYAVGTDDPQAYCLLLPFISYGRLNALIDQFGIDPSTCMYIAELGTAPAARGQGIAARLLQLAAEGCPTTTTSYLVRTLVINELAIKLYQKHGFEVIENVRQVHNNRERLFLKKTGSRI